MKRQDVVKNLVMVGCGAWAYQLAIIWTPESNANYYFQSAAAPAAQAQLMSSSDPYANLAPSLSLTATVRDFKAKNAPGGHPDFESFGNPYITTGLVKPDLDSDGKPVFAGKRGMQISTEFRSSNGQIINPAHYNPGMGDSAGVMSAVSSDQMTSESAFAQWFRNVPSVNATDRVPLTFKRVPGTARYVFDSATDEPYKSRGGFFPVNGELFGNYASTGKNFHFTTEIDTKFFFDRSKNHVFTFTGDDDVWVFIDGKLVMDLGGLHPKREQSLELNRLAWLQDNATHTLKVFHAERHTDQSNFRIETTLELSNARLPATTGLAD